MNKLSDDDKEDLKAYAVAIVICGLLLWAFLTVYPAVSAPQPPPHIPECTEIHKQDHSPGRCDDGYWVLRVPVESEQSQ